MPPATPGAYGITLRRPPRRALDADCAASFPLLAALAVAGSLVDEARSRPPARAPSAPTTPTFVVLLVAVIVIVAALTFFPALLLGPVVQGLTDQLGFPT